MTVFEAIIIGIIQGFTEFLPVSSSGHLILAGKILGTEISVLFELTSHLATLFCIVIVFRKELWRLIKNPFQKDMLNYIVATIPAVVIALIFKKFFHDIMDGRYLTFCFIFTAAVLTVSTLSVKKNPLPFGIKTSLLAGLAQSVAIFPGISRSGMTICTLSYLTGDRESSGKFSFIMSVPIILGSFIFECFDLAMPMNLDIIPLIAAFISSFLSGLIALKLFYKFIKKISFESFGVYLALLSAFMLINDLFLNLF